MPIFLHSISSVTGLMARAGSCDEQKFASTPLTVKYPDSIASKSYEAAPKEPSGNWLAGTNDAGMLGLIGRIPNQQTRPEIWVSCVPDGDGWLFHVIPFSRECWHPG